MELATVIPISATWQTEDDILLKKAVEEGAFLEALANGAIHFSHPSSLQEYNPDISTKACAHLSSDGPNKPKEINSSHRKKKVGSLRSRYFPMLKRVRQDFFSSANLQFLTENNPHSCAANRNDFHEQGLPKKTDFHLLQKNNYGCNNIISRGVQAGSKGTDSLLIPDNDDSMSKRVNQKSGDSLISGDFLDLSDSLFNFPSNDTLFLDMNGKTLIDNSCCDNTLSVLPMDIDGNETYKVEEKAVIQYSPRSTLNNQPCADIEWKMYCVLNTEDLEIPCNDDIFMLIHDEASSAMISVAESDRKPECIIARNSLLGLNSVIKSEELLQPSKPSLELPCNDIILFFHPETPCASSDMVSVVETDINPESIIDRNNLQEVNSVRQSEENFQLSKPSLELPCNDDIFLLIHPEIPCAYSDSLDIPCSENILLLTHPETPCASSDIILVATSDIDPLSIAERSNPQGLNSVKESEELLQSSEPSLEIPCNDDTFLIRPDTPCASSATISIAKSNIKPVSIIEENSVNGFNSIEKNEELTQPAQLSQAFLTLKVPEMYQVPGVGGPTLRDESNDLCKDLTTNKPARTSVASVLATNLNQDFKNVNSGAGDTPARLKELPLHTESGPGEIHHTELVVNPSISDHGSESEIDDPTFSDIEAMILDMSLSTCDADLHFPQRVSRYQQKNSQRKIIRLEQSAQVSIQRAMTSRGALAVLYGPRSRHLIRKKEVILGRSTKDTVVDIDLGKEGCRNKISRNQALLKMKDDGSFLLKNLAKNPMLVNGEKVGTGELASLSSSCLIEIRGISFMFESNQKFASHFLKNIEKKKQEQMAKFEWLPMEDETMS